MSAQAILDELAARQGWNTQTQLDLALQYIDNQGDDSTFEDFLVRVADEENAALEEGV